MSKKSTKKATAKKAALRDLAPKQDPKGGHHSFGVVAPNGQTATSGWSVWGDQGGAG